MIQVVCEEAPEPRTYGSRTKQKQRFVAGIVTPAQPVSPLLAGSQRR